MRNTLFTGVCLGLLVGFIIGLSISEVTGIILGALTSILLSFFGLKNGDQVNKSIVASFSFACLLAIIAGIFCRTHNLFSPSINSEIAKYNDIGLDKETINKIIVFQETGLIINNKEVKQADQLNNSKKTSLMSDEIKGSILCDIELSELTMLETRKKFNQSGGKFQELHLELSKVIEDTVILHNTLILFKNFICK